MASVQRGGMLSALRPSSSFPRRVSPIIRHGLSVSAKSALVLMAGAGTAALVVRESCWGLKKGPSLSDDVLPKEWERYEPSFFWDIERSGPMGSPLKKRCGAGAVECPGKYGLIDLT
eukprot:scaffold635_cov311-Pinguiococcus_pyrenoidosus.AAC.13